MSGTDRLSRALGAILVFASLCASAAERYEGIAYVPGTDRVAYRETDWVFERDGAAQRLVLYRCPGGAPFARKWVRGVPTATAPDFDFKDARDGYREGVSTIRGSRRIFVQENTNAPLQSRPLPPESNGVLDAGFDAFVRAHWGEFASGDSRRIKFLIPSRFEYLDFKISAAQDARIDGEPARLLKMKLAAWYGFALPAVELTYDPAGRRLEEFQGVGTVRDSSAHNQNVRIVFPHEEVRSGVADAEVDRAGAETLTSTCGG